MKDKDENQNTNLAQRRDAAIARGVNTVTQVYVERAKNTEVWDVQGRRYLDFAGGIAVVNTGHAHPRVQHAVSEQLDKFTHTCHQVLPYENYVRLAERLNQLVPGDFEKKTAFFTTGAEAVENSIKLARCFTQREAVICFGGGFHGRTYMGMSLTGKVKPYKQAGFGPLMNDVYHVPFPVELHGTSVEMTLAAIRLLFQTTVDPSRVAAILIEPVQGEGGFYPAPFELMHALRQLCNDHGIVLIADEVQTGFARTGKLFAMEHYDGIHADLTTMAKGLAGGFPLSAVTGRSEIVDAATPGGLGGTFAGHPMGIAAAHAVLDIMEDEKLCERACTLGTRLKQRLESLSTSIPQIVDVRGPGFMVAVEFNHAKNRSQPDPGFTKQVQQEALRRGLILLTCGVHSNVIRFLAPLTIPDEHMEEALDILQVSMEEAANNQVQTVIKKGEGLELPGVRVMEEQ